jgi:hypothetical protein
MGRTVCCKRCLLWLCVLSVLIAAGWGCVKVDGGAVEFSWVVYCHDGTRPGDPRPTCSSSCSGRASALSHIRLSMVGVGDSAGVDACAGRSECEFGATRQSGATPFFVPSGDYDIALIPLDVSGSPLGGPGCAIEDGSGCWATPLPIRRTIALGQAVGLGTLLIVVPDCPVTSGCPVPDAGCPAEDAGA